MAAWFEDQRSHFIVSLSKNLDKYSKRASTIKLLVIRLLYYRTRASAIVVLKYYYPTPSDSWGCEGILRRPNSRATPQYLDQKSKMEEVEPNMERRRGSDAGQSRRGWVRSCRRCSQALQKEFSFRCKKKSVTVTAKSGQFTLGETGWRASSSEETVNRRKQWRLCLDF